MMDMEAMLEAVYKDKEEPLTFIHQKGRLQGLREAREVTAKYNMMDWADIQMALKELIKNAEG